MKSLLLFIIVFISFVNPILGVNVENDPVTIVQPDGKEYQMYLTGDEFFMRMHDVDGYIICHEHDGYYYYAQGWSNDKWQASAYKVGEVKPRTTNLVTWLMPPADYIEREILPQREIMLKSLPLKSKKMTNGRSTAIVMLIKFSDQTDFTETYLNSIDSVLSAVTSKSVYTYYNEVSYGKLQLDGYIIRKTYTTPQPRAYFLPYNATTNPTGYVDNDDKNARRSAMLNAAVAFVTSDLPTGMGHDMNTDDKFDFVAFIIKGNAGAWSDLLWPHATSSSFGGKKINNLGFGAYTFLTENKTNLNTFTHEFYHNMGAPDLYRYTNTDISPAPDMFADGKHMNAYYKWKFSEGTWVTEIPEITEPGTYTLYPTAVNDNSTEQKCAYRIASPYHPNEFFVIEYRHKTPGTFDSSLPKSGLFTYRVNPEKNGNGGGPPDEIYLYRTNGNYLLDGSKDKHFGGKGLDYEWINDVSNPDANLTSGLAGGLHIEDIGVANDNILVKVNFTPVTKLLSASVFNISSVANSALQLIANDQNKVVALTGNNADWIIDYVGDGKWKILYGTNRLALTLAGNIETLGSQPVLSQYKGDSGQLWYIFTAANNQFRIVSALNKNTCIYNASGIIKTATYNSADNNHKWLLNRVGSHIVAQRPYRMVSAYNGKSVQSGTLQPTQNTWNINNRQHWLVEKQPDNNYLIWSVADSKYLKTDNDQIKLDAVGSFWSIDKQTDGFYFITDVATRKKLSVAVNNFGNGVALGLGTGSGMESAFIFSNITPFLSDVDPSTLTPDKITSSISVLSFDKQTIGNESMNKSFDVSVELPSTDVKLTLKHGNNFELLSPSQVIVPQGELFFTTRVNVKFLAEDVAIYKDTLVVELGANKLEIPINGAGALFYEPFSRNKATGALISIDELNNDFAWNKPWNCKNFKIYFHEATSTTRLDVLIGNARDGELVSPELQIEQPFKLSFKARMIKNSTDPIYNGKRNFYAIMGNDTIYNHKKTGSTLYQNYMIWSGTFASTTPESLRFTSVSNNSDFASDGMIVGEVLIEPANEPTLNIGKGKIVDLGEVLPGKAIDEIFDLKGWYLLDDINITHNNPVFLPNSTQSLIPDANKMIQHQMKWSFTAPSIPGVYFDRLTVTGGGINNGANDLFIKLTVVSSTGVNMPLNNNVNVIVKDNVVTITASESSDVEVYSIVGQMVKKLSSVKSAEVTLEKGVYIVRVGRYVQKIVI